MKDVRPKQHLTGGREGGDSAPLRGDAWCITVRKSMEMSQKSFVWGCSSPGRRLFVLGLEMGRQINPKGDNAKQVFGPKISYVLFSLGSFAEERAT